MLCFEVGRVWNEQAQVSALGFYGRKPPAPWHRPSRVNVSVAYGKHDSRLYEEHPGTRHASRYLVLDM